MTAREAMPASVVRIRGNATLRKTAQSQLEHGIGRQSVLDDRRLVEPVTRTDAVEPLIQPETSDIRIVDEGAPVATIPHLDMVGRRRDR